MKTYTVGIWAPGAPDESYWMHVRAETAHAAIAQVRTDSGLDPGGPACEGEGAICIHAWEGELPPCRARYKAAKAKVRVVLTPAAQN